MAQNNALNIGFTISLLGTFTTGAAVTFAGAFPCTFNVTGSTNLTLPTSGTLATTSSIVAWTDVTGTSQAMAVNSGYTPNNVGLVTLTLPTTSAFGSLINIVGKGAGGWKIAQNASQLIHLGSSVTTTGVAGSLASTNQFDSLQLVCTVADTVWTVTTGAQGNITVV